MWKSADSRAYELIAFADGSKTPKNFVPITHKAKEILVRNQGLTVRDVPHKQGRAIKQMLMTQGAKDRKRHQIKIQTHHH